MKKRLLLLNVLTFFVATAVNALDIDSLIADCDDCHGNDGISTHKDIPIIAGQSYVVLEDALLAFADNSQPCKESEYRHGDTGRAAVTMCEIASKLSADDIEAISEHYADLPFISANQTFDETQVARGAEVHDRNCEKCHSAAGSLADDDAGILAGQWTPYLRSAIDQFMSKERSMSKKMTARMKRVKEEDFEALLHFYASKGQ